MKASILTSERNTVANIELRGLTVWRRLCEKMKEFFKEPFQSEWEKKTGLEWREWSKSPYIR